jgi:Ca-activated chloride channel family protein
VSFQAPWFLLLLALLPLVVAAYLIVDKRRGRDAERFASARLMPSVAPVRPGIRRHLPLAAYALALAIGAVALARPEATVAVPEERAAVVLVTDTSGSMQARDVAPSRITAVRRAALDFLDRAPGELRVGAVSFNQAVQAIEPPRAERDRTRALIEGLRPSGGTATGSGLAAALGLLDRARDQPPGADATGGRRERAPREPAAVILISDGAATHGRDPLPVAREAARARVPVYTVALGTDSGSIQVERPDGSTVTRRVPPDRDTMRRIAAISGGRTFAANAGDELASVYERLGSRVATREERRQVTSAFAGGAIVLLILGGALSLRWFGRLP